MKLISLCILCNLIALPLLAMEQNDTNSSSEQKDENLLSIIVPGQNGLGGESFHRNNIINTAISHNCGTLDNQRAIDLGQDNCIRHFEEALKEKTADNNTLMLCATSQGTATAVNWLAKQPKKRQEDLVKCLVLEAVLGSGNSAILHTVKELSPLLSQSESRTYRFLGKWASAAINTPIKHMILLGAKFFVFPSYKPWGAQAFSSDQQLSTKIPIIIMHHVNDPQLSVNDARELYCILRKQGNEHVYFFEVNNSDIAHINTFDTYVKAKRNKRIAALQAIYKKYKLPYNDKIEGIDKVKLEKFQPSVTTIEEKITPTRTSSFS